MVTGNKQMTLTVQQKEDEVVVFDGNSRVTGFKMTSVENVITWLKLNLKNVLVEVL